MTITRYSPLIHTMHTTIKNYEGFLVLGGAEKGAVFSLRILYLFNLLYLWKNEKFYKIIF